MTAHKFSAIVNFIARCERCGYATGRRTTPVFRPAKMPGTSPRSPISPSTAGPTDAGEVVSESLSRRRSRQEFLAVAGPGVPSARDRDRAPRRAPPAPAEANRFKDDPVTEDEQGESQEPTSARRPRLTPEEREARHLHEDRLELERRLSRTLVTVLGPANPNLITEGARHNLRPRIIRGQIPVVMAERKRRAGVEFARGTRTVSPDSDRRGTGGGHRYRGPVGPQPTSSDSQSAPPAGSRRQDPMKRGRPIVLTEGLVREIARRRGERESHAEIAVALGIPVGTSRFGAWVSRHPDSLQGARLERPEPPSASKETSRAVSTSDSREARA